MIKHEIVGRQEGYFYIETYLNEDLTLKLKLRFSYEAIENIFSYMPTDTEITRNILLYLEKDNLFSRILKVALIDENIIDILKTEKPKLPALFTIDISLINKIRKDIQYEKKLLRHKELDNIIDELQKIT